MANGDAPAQLGCAYLNFSASHDGIGMRPAEGLSSEAETETVIDTVKSFGGRVSMRALPDGGEKPYELNITYFDALKGEDDLQFERFCVASPSSWHLRAFRRSTSTASWPRRTTTRVSKRQV